MPSITQFDKTLLAAFAVALTTVTTIADTFPTIVAENRLEVGLTHAVLGAQSAAIGSMNTVSADFSLAVGNNNSVTDTANGVASIAIGAHNSVQDAINSMAIGHHNLIDDTGASAADESVAVGLYNNLHGYRCIAVGGHNEVKGNFSTAVGLGLQTRSSGEVAVGRYNLPPTTYGTHNFNQSDGENIFVVGAGINATNRRNALVVTQTGKVILPQPQGDIPMFSAP